MWKEEIAEWISCAGGDVSAAGTGVRPPLLRGLRVRRGGERERAGDRARHPGPCGCQRSVPWVPHKGRLQARDRAQRNRAAHQAEVRLYHLPLTYLPKRALWAPGKCAGQNTRPEFIWSGDTRPPALGVFRRKDTERLIKQRYGFTPALSVVRRVIKLEETKRLIKQRYGCHVSVMPALGAFRKSDCMPHQAEVLLLCFCRACLGGIQEVTACLMKPTWLLLWSKSFTKWRGKTTMKDLYGYRSNSELISFSCTNRDSEPFPPTEQNIESTGLLSAAWMYTSYLFWTSPSD